MKKLILLMVAFAILTLFAWTGYFLYEKSQEKPVVYQTDKAFKADIVKKTVATGTIKPRKEIEIKPQVSGVVDKLYVEAGERVKKGDLLARIQLIPDMEHLSNAESRLESAQISLRNAKLELERQGKLFKSQLIGELEYNKYKLQYELQEEAVNSAENTVALIKEGASKKTGQVANLVRSTVEGMVLVVPVREGTFVTETNTFNQGTTIANVANMDDLIFEGWLDESEIGKVKVGMPLTLNVGALSGMDFDAVLEYVSPKGVNEQGTIKFEIKAAITLRDNVFLRAGYSANADIVLDQRSDVLAINEGNLIVENDKTFVEIQKADQVFTRKEIKVGLSDGINVEILDGLTASSVFKKLVK